MKMIIVSPEFPPNTVGGGGDVVKQLAGSLARNNRVTVLFGSWNSKPPNDGAGFSLIPVPLIRVTSSPSLVASMPPTLRGLLSLLRILSSERPDVVHLHGVGHVIVDVAAFACRRLSIPYLLICHGLPLSSNPYRTPARVFYRTYEKLIGSRTLLGATYVIAVSTRVARALRRRGVDPAKVKVVHHLPNQSPSSPLFNFKELVKIPRDRRVILCLGSISYRKGSDLAVKIVHQLYKLRDDFVLCIIGPDGGMQRELERTVQELSMTDRIRVIGRVESVVRDSALQACELVILPSRDEPYGLVPLEAIAYRKPVLISVYAGVAELVRDSELLFDPNDTWTAAEKIAGILDSPELKARLVEEAGKSFERISAEATSLYNELSLKSVSRGISS